jgi:hypothetical protein
MSLILNYSSLGIGIVDLKAFQQWSSQNFPHFRAEGFHVLTHLYGSEFSSFSNIFIICPSTLPSVVDVKAFVDLSVKDKVIRRRKEVITPMLMNNALS